MTLKLVEVHEMLVLNHYQEWKGLEIRDVWKHVNFSDFLMSDLSDFLRIT
jgi:hypothetical protein